MVENNATTTTIMRHIAANASTHELERWTAPQGYTEIGHDAVVRGAGLMTPSWLVRRNVLEKPPREPQVPYGVPGCKHRVCTRTRIAGFARELSAGVIFRVLNSHGREIFRYIFVETMCTPLVFRKFVFRLMATI